MSIVPDCGPADNWREAPAAQELLRRNPLATQADYEADRARWWDEFGRRSTPRGACEPRRAAPALLPDLPAYTVQWRRLIGAYPELARAEDRLFYGTPPPQLSVDEQRQLVGTLCRQQAEPILAALAPAMAEIARAVVRDELRRGGRQ